MSRRRMGVWCWALLLALGLVLACDTDRTHGGRAGTDLDDDAGDDGPDDDSANDDADDDDAPDDDGADDGDDDATDDDTSSGDCDEERYGRCNRAANEDLEECFVECLFIPDYCLAVQCYYATGGCYPAWHAHLRQCVKESGCEGTEIDWGVRCLAACAEDVRRCVEEDCYQTPLCERDLDACIAECEEGP